MDYSLIWHLLANHHDADDLLLLHRLHPERCETDPEPMRLPLTTMQVEELTRRIHEQHQLYLLQQDILGTFYDTLSIFSSLPLFKRLQTIRIVDFEIPPDVTPIPEETPYTLGHEAAVCRAIHSISKTLALLHDSALPNLRCWEIERFDYSVLRPQSFCSSSRNRKDDEIWIQFEDALSRISNFKIDKLNCVVTGQQHCPFVLAEVLMNGGNYLEELAIADDHSGEEDCCVSTSEIGFPWGYSLCNYMRRHVYHRRCLDSVGHETTVGTLFPCLRKLELSGHSSMGLLNLAGLFFCLTPGILKELVLESLAMADGGWEDLFRIIAPKTKWTEENQVWPGAHAHAIVQAFLSSSSTVQLNVEHLVIQLKEHREQAQQTVMQPRPTRLLWKGLQLEKCQLKDLQYLEGDEMKATRQSLRTSVGEALERWMLKGLDDGEYEVLLPNGHNPAGFEIQFW